jgi:hypothetical protein
MYNSLRAVVLLAGLLAAAGFARAQITETPVTVQPGRFLLEMDAISVQLDEEPGYKYTAFAAASTFLSTGLTANLDLQVGAELFISQKVDLGGLSERDSGIGDIYVRSKWRFYDDPASGTAVALLPYVKLPTNSGGVGNDAVEGGVILPWTTSLPGGFDVAAMAELDFLRNDADDGYDTSWYFSGYLSRDLTGSIGVYAEAALAKSSGGGDTEGVMGAGITLAVSDRAWWDVATYKGISDAAADWNHVVRFNLGF